MNRRAATAINNMRKDSCLGLGGAFCSRKLYFDMVLRGGHQRICKDLPFRKGRCIDSKYDKHVNMSMKHLSVHKSVCFEAAHRDACMQPRASYKF
eukprot:6172747-Pleurochrysis_carterae.AAC.3